MPIKKVSDLENDLHFVTEDEVPTIPIKPKDCDFFEISYNLYDGTNEVGRLVGNAITLATVDSTQTTYATSDYIELPANSSGKNLLIQIGNNINYNRYVFFDSNRSNVTLASFGYAGNTIINIPNGAKYLRVSVDISGIGFLLVAVTDGASALPYVENYCRLKAEYYNKHYFYYGRKVAFYGDSITARGNWEPHVAKYFGFSQWVNCGVGGSTVADVDTSLPYDPNPNQPMVTDARINTLPTDSDVIVFFGGANDWGAKVVIGEITDLKDGAINDEHFKSAYMHTIKKIQTRCPNAVLICATPINGRLNTAGVAQDYPTILSNGKKLVEYANAIKEVASEYSIPCIDIFSECRINVLNAPNYLDDTIHQNADGAKLLANAFINGLKRFEPITFA